MRFVLFVEGETEPLVLPGFLKKWLDNRLSQPVRIKPVVFSGWGDFKRQIVRHVNSHMKSPTAGNIIAAIGLLDLYGPDFYPANAKSAKARYKWGVEHFEREVNHPQFKMFFATHELEAWILSQPEVLPQPVREALPGRAANPETVNFDEHPSKLLEKLYRKHLHRKYKKTTDGVELFSKLDPKTVRDKCPRFKEMLDGMLSLANDKGM